MQHYRPEIDGLRSFAVLGVVLYHFGLLGFDGGFLGVDVFFVISGYLIGGIVFDEIARTGDLSFSMFWLRRARRILPALFCVLAVTGVFSWGLLAGTTLMPAYARSLLAALISASNFLFFSESGYFDTQAINKPLLHTWSLAVEEQFYVLFPLLIYVFLIRMTLRKQTFMRGLIVCTLASWGACMIVRHTSESFAFFMLPTRLWEPLAGCALAYASRWNLIPTLPQRLCNALEVAAALVILGCLQYAPHDIGAWNSLVVAATLLLIHSRLGLISRILSTRPFVWVGKISYSLYLWHWPLLVLASLYWLRISKSYKISLLLLSVLCACLSYLFVEQPFRQGHITWRHITKRLLPVAVCLCCFGLAGVLLRQAPAVLLPDEPGIADAYRSAAQIDKDDVYHVGTGHNIQFLVFGDSHAACISPALAELAAEHGVGGVIISAIGLFTHPDYQLADKFDEQSAFVRSIHAYIKRSKVKTLLLVGRWHTYIYGQATKSRWKMAYRNQPVKNNPEIFTKTMKEALREWLDAGITVYILEQVPEHNFDSLERAALVRSSSPAREYTEQVNFLRDLVQEMQHPNLHLVRTADIFREGNEYAFVKDGKLLYGDYNHLNLFGARLLAGTLEPFFTYVREAAKAHARKPVTPN